MSVCTIYVSLPANNGISQAGWNMRVNCQEKRGSRPIIRVKVDQNGVRRQGDTNYRM